MAPLSIVRAEAKLSTRMSPDEKVAPVWTSIVPPSSPLTPAADTVPAICKDALGSTTSKPWTETAVPAVVTVNGEVAPLPRNAVARVPGTVPVDQIDALEKFPVVLELAFTLLVVRTVLPSVPVPIVKPSAEPPLTVKVPD